MLRDVAPPDNLPLSHTINPYWDVVCTIPGNDLDWEFERVWSPDWTHSYLSGGPDRHTLCRAYAFAIPDPDSLQFVATWLKPCAVEIGAGMGYWAWQMTQLDVDTLAYDVDPPDDGYNFYHNRDNDPGIQTFHPVHRGTPDVLKEYTDRTLFLCWPPMSDMAHHCLECYQGKRLVYIGERGGGCTANEAFFEKVEQEWKEVAGHRPVQWWGIHDWITVYERV